MSDKITVPTPSEKIMPTGKNQLVPEKASLEAGFSSAFQLVDDVVLKNYITMLPDLDVVPPDESQLGNSLGKMRLFKITEMVYEKDESATYKFASVFNAVAATNSALVTVIDSDGIKTNFYLGIRSLSDGSTYTAYSTLENAMKGQFPGTKVENLRIKSKENKESKESKEDTEDTESINHLLKRIPTASISAVSCVANNKNKDFVENTEYLQGLEKLALAMQGKKYTAVIVANPASQEQLNLVRESYENIYTQLSPFANSVVSYGCNQSTSVTKSETDTSSESDSRGNTDTEGSGSTFTKQTEGTETEVNPTVGSKIGSTIGSTLSIAGAIIGSVIPGPGTAAGAAIGSAIGGLVGSAISTATNKTVSRTTGGKSESNTTNYSRTRSVSHTTGTSHSLAVSMGLTTGETQNLQLTVQNKPIIDMLDRIDKQLERLSESESIGMWECAAYFLSEDSAISEVAAATYKALVSGENTGLEVSAINTWNTPENSNPEGTPTNNQVVQKNEIISKYILNFMHPVFSYKMDGYSIPVTPASLVSGNELAIHMGLPRHSVCGFPVIEHADFGKEVIRYGQTSATDEVQLGTLYSMGRAMDGCKVSLDVESLAMHTFIVGATGSGKSNTIYKILDRLTTTRDGLTFMVVEPAKGEYKRVFGHKKGRNVSVFGTNPEYTKLLQINPFKFPKGIHVLEHVDRLIEIFNVCWPMYAAMPAVLKEAVLAAYTACGWDLTTSKNLVAENLYPTFQDLLEQLIVVINQSGYSDEVKSNYVGSLTTRVRSLTNGLNGQIFSSKEIDNNILFDSNVIVDLSRIGSQETKALIMGILVMRLNEHRMSNATESNSKLRHITVLEEAHNILGSTSQNTNVEGGATIAGKSVEMIANAIAEMRSYGEGFIIADQSPGAVNISAIRNTNTKIIMRLPEEADRRVAGKAAALKDVQIDEIARLPKGVAVVYQNDWIEPVMCAIDKYSGKEDPFFEPSLQTFNEGQRESAAILVNFIIKNRLDDPEKIICSEIEAAIDNCDCSVGAKTTLHALVKEYRLSGTISLWKDNGFSKQSHLVAKVIGLQDAVDSARKIAEDGPYFSCQLNTAIAQKVSRVNDDLLLAISHCLIKAYSEDNREHLEFYKNWVDNIEQRGRMM